MCTHVTQAYTFIKYVYIRQLFPLTPCLLDSTELMEIIFHHLLLRLEPINNKTRFSISD